MDRFLETQTFSAVVDAGSFVKAADALGMSKAAMSRYVGDLEARLGVRLLHRTTRRLSLTEDGQVFHARCKELLSGVDEAEAEITSGNADASGLVHHAIVAYSYWSTKDEWHFDGPQGKVSVRTQPCIHTNSGDTCREAALVHQGVILQPTFLVGEDLAAGTLVELMPEFKSIELGIYAVYPTRKH